MNSIKLALSLLYLPNNTDIFFSDEEIKLDLQQQRIERAVGEELKATPTVITKTGIFDNIDKLYGSSSGGTTPATSTATEPSPPGGDLGGGDLGGAPPPPAPEGGTETPPAEGAVTPESRMDNLNILVESNLIEGTQFLDLGQGQDSLGEMSSIQEPIYCFLCRNFNSFRILYNRCYFNKIKFFKIWKLEIESFCVSCFVNNFCQCSFHPF